MASYKTHHIAILFQLLLAKGEKPPGHANFTEVSESIGRTSSLDDPDISTRYLQDQFKSLSTALKNRDDSFHMNPDYLAVLCKYIGYKSYAEFLSVCDEIVDKLDLNSVTSAKLLIYHSSEDRDYIKHRTKGCFYPGQNPRIITEEYDKDLGTLLDNWVKTKIHKQLLIWCLPLEDVTPETIDLIIRRTKGFGSVKNIVPLLPESDDQTKIEGLGSLHENEHFHVVVAYCHHLILSKEDSEKKKDKSERGTINVFGNGPVISGNVSVNGEYISQGDMHITINKQKS